MICTQEALELSSQINLYTIYRTIAINVFLYGICNILSIYLFAVGQHFDEFRSVSVYQIRMLDNSSLIGIVLDCIWGYI